MSRDFYGFCNLRRADESSLRLWRWKRRLARLSVSVVDLKSRKELRRIKVGDGPWGIAIVPKG